jgi:signal transduction histidine kinase
MIAPRILSRVRFANSLGVYGNGVFREIPLPLDINVRYTLDLDCRGGRQALKCANISQDKSITCDGRLAQAKVHTVFTVFKDLRPGPYALLGRFVPANFPASMSETVNILLVDDQPGKLLSYEVILAGLGQNLIKAQTGKEALEHLLKNDIAMILMDVSMPDQNGFELADMIRQHPRFQDRAIIFISGVHLSDTDRLKGYELGAVDYISVPIIPELLRAKVKVFAELHRKTRQLEVLNRELDSLTRRMISVQDEERRRIAREVHDSLGQELIAAKMMVDTIPAAARGNAEEAGRLIESALQQVRNISHLLHPPLLDDIGLCSAIDWYVEGLTRRSGIDAVLEVQPGFPRLVPELETAVYRVVQEALTNVFRHSGARSARVSLLVADSKVVVRVCDDGHGVGGEVAAFEPGSIGVGVGGMRQRIKEFGGELRLKNLHPGTLVEAVIPLKLTSKFPAWPAATSIS